MEHGRTATDLTEAVRSVQLLKVGGYCATKAMYSSDYIKFRWNVDGHEWEVRLYPTHYIYKDSCYANWVALKLILLSEPQRDNKLRANLSCRLVDPSGNLNPSAESSVSCTFQRCEDGSSEALLVRRDEVPKSGYLVNDSLTVQCTITVLKEVPDVVILPAVTEVGLLIGLESTLHPHQLI
ncbi:unnamed protein product [Urochloa humidicola]